MSSNFKLSKLISNMTLMQTTWFFKNIICFSFFHLCIVLAFGCFPKIHWSHTLPQGCSRLIKNRVAKHFKKPSVYYGKKLIVLKKKVASPMTQWWRIRLQCKKRRFNLWVGKMPWRRKWQPTPVFLPGKSHCSLAGYSPWGHKKVRHNRLNNNNK